MTRLSYPAQWFLSTHCVTSILCSKTCFWSGVMHKRNNHVVLVVAMHSFSAILVSWPFLLPYSCVMAILSPLFLCHDHSFSAVLVPWPFLSRCSCHDHSFSVVLVMTTLPLLFVCHDHSFSVVLVSCHSFSVVLVS